MRIMLGTIIVTTVLLVTAASTIGLVPFDFLAFV